MTNFWKTIMCLALSFQAYTITLRLVTAAGGGECSFPWVAIGICVLIIITMHNDVREAALEKEVFNQLESIFTEYDERGEQIVQLLTKNIQLRNIVLRQAPHAKGCIYTHDRKCSCWKSEFMEIADAR